MTLAPHPRFARAIIAVAAFYGLSGTALSALTTHLPSSAFVPGGREMAWHGVWMQMWHAPVLLALGVAMIASDRFRGYGFRWAAAGLSFGIALFCAAVYAIAFTGRHSGIVAPTGGMIVMASWIMIGIAGLRVRA